MIPQCYHNPVPYVKRMLQMTNVVRWRDEASSDGSKAITSTTSLMVRWPDFMHVCLCHGMPVLNKERDSFRHSFLKGMKKSLLRVQVSVCRLHSHKTSRANT